MAEGLDLDHVAVVVRDLDIAERNFKRLGFLLTPRSSHKGPVPPDGRIEPWGTGNHCSMFRQGYLELLGITDPARHKTHIERRLSKYEGLHLIAFGTDDAHGTAKVIRDRGAPIGDPADLGRDVPYGDTTRPGRFAIANLDADRFPEADFIVIEQMTRDVLWQPALLTQPNGVVSLESVTICSDDPDDLLRRLTPVLGNPSNGGFDLSPGRVEICVPSEMSARFPGHGLPGEAPCVVAATFGVDDLAATRNTLVANGVEIDVGDVIRVGAEIGCGSIIEFAPAKETGDHP